MRRTYRLTSILAFSLLACGSDNRTKAPPFTNLNGNWSIAATVASKTCSDSPTIPPLVVIVHDGTSSTFTIALPGLSSVPVTGSIDGSSMAFDTTQTTSECSSLAVDVNLTLSDKDHANGTATYQCTWTGGSCGGTLNLTVARQQ